MKFFGNLIWIIFGGFFVFLEYIIAGIVLCITIIGIPFGFQCFKLGVFALWPFGYEAIDKPRQSGCLNTLMNVVWIFIGGISICLTHLLFGVLFCITIIGIPFGKQHFKLAGFSLVPFGKEIKKV